MAKGDYYFPLYYKRLLTSTIGWKDDEFGAYLRLLIYQFDNGSLPSDVEELKRIAPSIKKHWPLISKKFKDDGNGRLINDVMDEIYHEIQEKKDKSKQNGKSGGRPVAVKPGQIRFYLIECFNQSERFYKAGVTNDSIKKRYSSSSGNGANLPYSYIIIYDLICESNLGLCLEKTLAERCEKYQPQIKFGGHKECYKISENVLEIINQTVTQKNPAGYFSESETKAILITNNQESITKERETPPTQKNGWNIKPGIESISLELPDMKVNAVIELFAFSKNTKVEKSQVLGLWSVFKHQNFSGEKYYASPNEAYKHFINWCKTQDVKALPKPELTISSINAREDKARKILNM